MLNMDGMEFLRAIKADDRFDTFRLSCGRRLPNPDEMPEGIKAGVYY
jgi:hypothetical protein